MDESTLKEKLPALVYDQLWKIDFNLFMLISQAIGRTFLPPYWSLGFQLSRWGYNKIETVKNLVENMTEHDLSQVTYSILLCNDNILHKNLFRFNIYLSQTMSSNHFDLIVFQDVQYGDIDYMIRQKDFTYDPVNFKGLPQFVRSIKNDGLRYIIILVSNSFLPRSWLGGIT